MDTLPSEPREVLRHLGHKKLEGELTIEEDLAFYDAQVALAAEKDEQRERIATALERIASALERAADK